MLGMGLALTIGMAIAGQGADAGARVVEPSRLTSDPDLIGREVVVDDRVRLFLAHKKGGKDVFDGLLLKRTDVVFKLPPSLRPDRPPRQPSARVRGILRSEGKAVTCEVHALDMMPADLERLDLAVKRLGANDAAGRVAWATWAEDRAKSFNDADLAARGKAIEAEALLIEAGRSGADDLALSKRARARDLGDDLASALAHRGLRPRLSRAKSADELAKMAVEIESFLPGSADPKGIKPGGEWTARVEADPISAYRQAPAEVRAGLDRAIWAEAIRRNLERRLADAPGDAFALAEEAKAKLPDRPELAGKLRDKGLAASESNVAVMRLSEVEALAKTFRDDGQPGRARDLYKTWLDDQRKRLNASDADGLILLSGQYLRLLDDRLAAASLLNDALKTDPESKSAADAFRRMNYRKSPEGVWFDPRPATTTDAAPSGTDPAPTARGSSGSLRGMSVEQVRAKLGGKPDRISRSATQDETIEQWIYRGPRGTQVVNIRRTRGSAQAEVVSYYSVP